MWTLETHHAQMIIVSMAGAQRAPFDMNPNSIVARCAPYAD
jgi:hypothetical protein